MGHEADALEADVSIEAGVQVVEQRQDPVPECPALRGQVDQFVASVGGVFAPFDAALLFEDVHQAAQCGFTFCGAGSEHLLRDALFAPQGAEHLDRFVADVDAVLSEGSLEAFAEGDAHADNGDLEVAEIVAVVYHAVWLIFGRKDTAG